MHVNILITAEEFLGFHLIFKIAVINGFLLGRKGIKNMSLTTFDLSIGSQLVPEINMM
jgi:hypothetical protein